MDVAVRGHHNPYRKRIPVVPSSVLGMLIFIVSEAMFFAGLSSAFTISKANTMPGMWPPPGQPRLPAEATAFNTAALILSGVVLLYANWCYRKSKETAKLPVGIALFLGVLFVGLQGREWVAMIHQGMTITSSRLGSFFYLMVGMHGLHALIAIGALGIAFYQLSQKKLQPSFFFGVQAFWYFVVVLWPFIYARVYF